MSILHLSFPIAPVLTEDFGGTKYSVILTLAVN